MVTVSSLVPLAIGQPNPAPTRPARTRLVLRPSGAAIVILPGTAAWSVRLPPTLIMSAVARRFWRRALLGWPSRLRRIEAVNDILCSQVVRSSTHIEISISRNFNIVLARCSFNDVENKYTLVHIR